MSCTPISFVLNLILCLILICYNLLQPIILIQSFIRFASANYICYDNARSGTVGDR
jgi:hypothetical protein